MDILIKGMDMPKSCEVCPVRDYEEGHCLLSNERSTLKVPKRERASWCPLIELPPHGRLIDADLLEGVLILTLESLKENPKMNKEEMHLIAAFRALGVMIVDAPTIIEAEGD